MTIKAGKGQVTRATKREQIIHSVMSGVFVEVVNLFGRFSTYATNPTISLHNQYPQAPIATASDNGMMYQLVLGLYLNTLSAASHAKLGFAVISRSATSQASARVRKLFAAARAKLALISEAIATESFGAVVNRIAALAQALGLVHYLNNGGIRVTKPTRHFLHILGLVKGFKDGLFIRSVASWHMLLLCVLNVYALYHNKKEMYI